MAANDYYNPSVHHDKSHTPQPPYQSYNPPHGAPSTNLPPYTSQPASRVGSARPTEISPVSPFEAPFDDHVYPMGGTAQRYDSQSTLGPDTRYYGQGGGGRQDSTSSFRDDIPLRDHPAAPPKNASTDHVYDAGDPEAPNRPNNQYSNQPYSNTQYPPLEEPGRNKKGGFFNLKKNGRIPFVVYTFSLIQIIVFIVEIVKNAQLTGSPIEIHPSFNPMIGPSPFVLINMGARYMPCMHNVHGVQDAAEPFTWPCPNSTTNSGLCSLGQLCGFGGVPSNWTGNIDQKPEPDQWFRFIIPMFMHAGIIHIGFNLLLQLTLGKEMEILIGPIRFFLVYVASGIFGFVLGGNFAAPGIASTGASGALFGILALVLLDLLYHWSERRSPWMDLAFIMLDVVISFVLGLLPGLDNFSHIGGFFMGLVLGICLLHSPASLQKRIGQDPPYTPVNSAKADGEIDGVVNFAKAPVGFFKGRKPAWWAWWLVRAASLVFVLIVFILLLNNFYKYKKTCSWCKYLSCLPIKNWCDVGNIQLTNVGSNTTSKRSVFDTWDGMAKLYET